MAGIGSKLESLLRCVVCKDTVRQPKTLQCFHSFCEECVIQLPKSSRGDKQGVKCPVCRKFTEENEVNSNYLMKELVEMHRGMQSGNSNQCEMCEKEKGCWRCVECRQFLCNNCKVLHVKVPTCRNHQIVAAEDTDTAIDRLVFCEKHTDQTVALHCQECDQLLCMKCNATKHKTHNTDTIEDTLERVLPDMEGYCDKIKKLIDNINKNKDELEARKAEIKAAFDKCRKDGENQLQKIIDRATEDYNALVKELDIREEEEVDKLRRDRQKEYKQLVEWMETCKETAKGVTLMQQIQKGLRRRMRELAELQTIEQSRDRINLPELVLSTGNFSVEENVIGKIDYKTIKMLQAELTTDCRNPEKPFKDILQGQFKQSKQVELKGWCKRISFIQGDIWTAVYRAKCIQVIDMGGNPQKDISCTFTPHSVKEAPWGDIIVASDTGLHVLCHDGTVQSTICNDKFYDVCFFGEEVVGLNSSKRILQMYIRSGDGEWRHSGDIMASWGIGSSTSDCVVTRGDDIVFTMLGESIYHYYKCEGKTGKRKDCNSNQSAMSLPFVCGVDSTGAVLVADHNKSSFQVHESENQWLVVSLKPISSHKPRDFLYDADTDTVWVLSRYYYCDCVTKLEKQQ